jgi:heterodisulfide reductase subunit B
MAKKEYSFYPGCSSERKVSAANYMVSVESMCKTLDIKLNEIPDWNCSAPPSVTPRAASCRATS